MNSNLKNLLLVVIILCSGEVSANSEMIPGEKLQKMISLEFNEYAYKAERNEYLDFSIQYDTSNFIAQCSPDFSIQNNTLRVYAVEYLEKVVNQAKEGIVVTFLPKESAKEQSYDFKIVLLEQSISEGLKTTYEYVDPENTIVEFNDINYFVPMPLGQKIAIYGGSILIVIFLLWFILTRDNMPFGKKTFKTGGVISIRDINNIDSSFNLKLSKRKYGMKILSTDTTYSLDGASVTVRPQDWRCEYTSKKRRFAILEVDNVVSGNLVNSNDETINMNYVLGPMYNNDEITFSTLNGGKIVISYLNKNINRQ